MKKTITKAEQTNLLQILKTRFQANMHRHKNLEWEKIEKKLLSSADKLWSIHWMENTAGEPDVIDYDKKLDEYMIADCSAESPKDRRSLCYDEAALNSRKENKPNGSAMKVAEQMGVELLNEEQYFLLQSKGDFDLKTSSWLKTPEELRKLGGAIFGDKRYKRTFSYHNGGESYYAARGFRTFIKI